MDVPNLPLSIVFDDENHFIGIWILEETVCGVEG